MFSIHSPFLVTFHVDHFKCMQTKMAKIVQGTLEEHPLSRLNQCQSLSLFWFMHIYIYIFPPNRELVGDIVHCVPLPKMLQDVIPKNKDILSCNHSTLIKVRKFESYCLIHSSCFPFVSCANKTSYCYFSFLAQDPIQNHTLWYSCTISFISFIWSTSSAFLHIS